MGFKDVKKQVVKCIEEGAYEHEARNYTINFKNLFATGQISEQKVIELIQCCSGQQYEISTHHADAAIKVHILKPVNKEKIWYIKFYFLEPNVVFISPYFSQTKF